MTKGNGALLLGIDTCGPAGSVALGRVSGESIEILGERELEGRTYSATLIAAVSELLSAFGPGVGMLGGIVAVRGPGSFTGVRVGLSAAKGLAEAVGTPVVAVSRLEVLAHSSGIAAAAIDAHRREVFLRIGRMGGPANELLAGESELALLGGRPGKIAVCDDAAAELLSQVWPAVRLVRVPPPTAPDALRFAAAKFMAGEFAEIALLDGHYLRRSDAEIFGEPAARGAAGT